MSNSRVTPISEPTLTLAALLMTFMLAVLPMSAQAGDSHRTVPFSIPSQQLSSALVQFADQAGVQFTAPGTSLKGIVTRGVHGDYEPAVALGIMLRATGLTYRFIDPRTVAISLPGANPRANSLSMPGDGTGKEGKNASSGGFRVAQMARGSDTENDSLRSASSLAPNLLQEVVVSATRSAEQVKDIPRSITVIDAGMLKTQLAQTGDISSILALQVPGMAAGVEGRNSSQGENNIRGRRAQFVVDGVVMNNTFLDLGYEEGSVDPETIERIEVIRGGTAVYGFGATGGVINVITRSPLAGDTGADTTVRLRTYTSNLGGGPTAEFHQDARYVSDTCGIDVHGTYGRTGNGYDADGNRLPSLNDAFDSRSFSGGLDAGVHLTSSQTLLARASLLDTRVKTTYAPVGAVPSKGILPTAENLGLNIPSTQVQTAAGGLSLLPQFQRASMEMLDYDNTEVLGSDANLMLYNENQEERTPGVIEGKLAGKSVVGATLASERKNGGRLTITTPLQGNEPGSDLTWGLDAQHETFGQPYTDTLGHPDTTFPALTPSVASRSYAGFMQATIKLFHQWTLTGGVRYETSSAAVPTYVVALGPRAGKTVQGGTLHFHDVTGNAGVVFQYRPWLQPYVSFSQGYTIGEALRSLRQTSATSVTAAIDLQPQTTYNYEVGTRGTIARSTYYTIAAFYSPSPLGATLLLDPITGIAYVERAPERTYGVEATIDEHPTEALDLGGTASWEEGTQDVNGETLPLDGTRVAPAKLTFYGTYRLTRIATLRADMLFTGSRHKFPGSTQFGEGRVTSGAVFDAALAFTLPRGALTLAVENLFNREYVNPTIQALNNAQSYYAATGRLVSISYSVPW